MLVDSCRDLARAIRDERAVTPTAEWLVDNFPIVGEQLHAGVGAIYWLVYLRPRPKA